MRSQILCELFFIDFSTGEIKEEHAEEEKQSQNENNTILKSFSVNKSLLVFLCGIIGYISNKVEGLTNSFFVSFVVLVVLLIGVFLIHKLLENRSNDKR